MRYLHLGLAFVTSAVIIGSSVSQTLAQAQAPQAPKPQSTIGLVDRDKVVLAYPRAEQLAKELKREEDRVHKMIEDGNKQLEEAKAAKKPPADLEGLQRRLQEQIDGEVKKVQSKAQSLESQLESEVNAAIKAEAAAKRVDIVLWKPVVFMGGVDLTEGVMKRLQVATAPTGAKVK
ncbi:MAG TPA: OmpH family outer membrane protein [Candidatus Obscuribacterales bacterium]